MSLFVFSLSVAQSSPLHISLVPLILHLSVTLSSPPESMLHLQEEVLAVVLVASGRVMVSVNDTAAVGETRATSVTQRHTVSAGQLNATLSSERPA